MSEERAKRAAYARKWRAANRARERETQADRAANADRIRQQKRAYYDANRQRVADRAAAWKKANPNAVKESKARYLERNRERISLAVRSRKYGLSPEKLVDLLASQGNACAICRQQLRLGRDKSAHIDHDHATGDVRGVLCTKCNLALGAMNDSPSLLRAAATYLDRRQPKLRLA